MNEINNKRNKNEKNQTNILYFAGFFLFMLFHLFKNVNYSFDEFFLEVIKYLSLIFSFTFFVLNLRKYSHLYKIMILFILLLSIIVGFKSEGFKNQLIMTPLLVFGAKGIGFNKILKFSFLVNAFFCMSVISLCFIGLIDNYVVVSETRELLLGAATRNSFGYIWPTNLANHIFFILLMYWILKEGKLGIASISIYCVIIYFVIYYTDSKLGAGCILLLVFMTLLLKLKKENLIKSWPKLSFLFVVWIPLVTVLIFIATLKYDASDPVWLVSDILLSGRLHISQDTITQYGIPFWGQKIKMYGGDLSGDLYNYVDSAYLQMFIIWGIFYTILYLLGYFFVGVKCYKDKNEIMLLALFVAGITGVIAQHFMEIYMNPLLIYLIADSDYYMKKVII